MGRCSESLKAFVEVIHGGRSSLWWTEEGDKQPKARKWRECRRVGGGCQLRCGANGFTSRLHAARVDLTFTDFV